jgi:hypothetical protein
MRPFVPIKNLDWYENLVKETIAGNVQRSESASSNESSSR